MLSEITPSFYKAPHENSCILSCVFQWEEEEMSQRQYPHHSPEIRDMGVEVGSSGPLPSAICSLHKLIGRRVIAQREEAVLVIVD